MDIKTTNHPIIINGIRESQPSDYLSADGGDEFYNADGDEFYNSGGEGDDFYGAEGLSTGRFKNPNRATNIALRLQRNQRLLAHVQERMAKIKSRAEAAGKQLTSQELSLLDQLTAKASAFQAKIDKLSSLASSSVDGSGDEFYNADGEEYSYIDKSNSGDVRQFQLFALTKGADLSFRDKNGNLVTGQASADGVFGPKTADAYSKFGVAWEAMKNPLPPNQEASVQTTPPPTLPSGQQPSKAEIEKQKKRGVFWDKAKGVWIYAKDSGILNSIAGWFGLNTGSGGSSTAPVAPTTTTEPQTDPKKRKLSTGAKIGIGVGIAIVIGLIIYSSNKKK